jgi:hypothetical protein
MSSSSSTLGCSFFLGSSFLVSTLASTTAEATAATALLSLGIPSAMIYKEKFDKFHYFLTWLAVFPLQAATTKATTVALGLIPAEARTSVMFLSAKKVRRLKASFTDVFSG